MAEEGEQEYEFYAISEGQMKKQEKGSQQYFGKGKALFANGDVYLGDYVMGGIRTGRGTYTWKNGDVYDGECKENKKHGYGKMVYRNEGGEGDGDDAEENKQERGGTYLGFFHGGKRGCVEDKHPDEADSNGTFTYVNGDTYVGQWCAGKKHGRGVYTYAGDGSKLMGEWEKGKMTVGKWVFPNGAFYSGKFRYNKPIDRGVWVFPNGNQLTGTYEQNKDPADEGADAGDPAEEGEVKEKPDPKVFCTFIPAETVAVHGGLMDEQVRRQRFGVASA